ncbi:hypothetical protein SAMN05444008_105210 [Cnuella takakiae]|uniref:Uncharacterized protein n=1 Tax=Cnuella takakiae TaxID=1302690 RepID=A0A1M4ZFZ7_9BACT|nr:hypothetical protein BUE76_21785 [Cnuella takakiae]SHF16960.1 hypothetical protein SAMN05444008_105210 [Cnuella takakiae]
MQWIVVVLILGWHVGSAQNADEWLRQRKTQLRYLAEQAAALRMYAGHLERGYGVVQGGLALISDVKTGEFSLHKDYFNSLQNVKPAVRGYWKVGAITLSAHRILGMYLQSGGSLAKVKVASRQYYQQLFNAWSGLLSRLARTLSEVQLSTGSNTFSLQDASRLQQIDRLYDQMQGHEAFAVELYSSSKSIEYNIKLETASGKLIRSLYGN